jgi:hypothetical protein
MTMQEFGQRINAEVSEHLQHMNIRPRD